MAECTIVSKLTTPKEDIYDPYRKSRTNQSNKFAGFLEKALDNSSTHTQVQQSRLLLNDSQYINANVRPVELSWMEQTSNISDAATSVLTDSTGYDNISAEEKSFLDSIRPEFYDDARYAQILKDYDERLGLLNPYNLPRTASGFQLVTWPQPGKSASTEMVRPPSFTLSGGGIMRTDYTKSGEVKTFIPVTEWRKVLDGGASGVGSVYSQQLPWGFRCYFDRGGGPPYHLGYKENGFSQRVEEYLKRTESGSREELQAKLENILLG